MGAFKEDRFSDRLKSAGEARKAMLARFQERPAADDPALAARRAEREAISTARAVRLAEREAVRHAEVARVETERVRLREQAAADQARDAAEAQARAAKLQADQKAARDARYAARKARRGA
jgi:hypothetical protein